MRDGGAERVEAMYIRSHSATAADAEFCSGFTCILSTSTSQTQRSWIVVSSFGYWTEQETVILQE